MVEGGARIIQSFLAESPNASMIDTVIITVAPTFVGDDGVGYGANIASSSVSFVSIVHPGLPKTYE